jgi:hypothetical protein
MLALMMSPYLVVRLLSVVTHRDFNTRGAAAVGLTILFHFYGHEPLHSNRAHGANVATLGS